jgi:hypothetical protein
VFAGWRQSAGVYSHSCVNRYDAGSGTWGTAQQLDTIANTGNGWPELAVDASGNAVAIWAGEPTFLAGRSALFARRYASGSWGTADRLDPNDFGASGQRLAFDGAGNLTVVWQQAASSSYLARTDIYTRRWTSGGGWGAPAALLETDDTGNATLPDVDADALGTAIAVWQQPEPGNASLSRVWAARWDGSAWGSPVRLDTSSLPMQFPGIALDRNGNAFAMWRRYQAITVHASRFDAATLSWSGSEVIGTDKVDPQIKAFTIHTDTNGNAVALWSDGSHLRTSRWLAGHGWEGQVQLNVATTALDQPGEARFDATGKLYAIWTQYAGAAYHVVFSTWQ